MPSEIKETSITIDYDTGIVLVDTNNRGVASKLARQGFVEVTKPSPGAYRRFSGEISQVSFRRGKSEGRVKNGQKAIKNIKSRRGIKSDKSKSV